MDLKKKQIIGISIFVILILIIIGIKIISNNSKANDDSNLTNVYVATGYKKWGITTSNIAANIIKDKILNKNNEYEEIFKATRMEPIKNIKEVENMLKETTNSLVINKIKIPNDKVSDINKEDASIIEIDGRKIGMVEIYHQSHQERKSIEL